MAFSTLEHLENCTSNLDVNAVAKIFGVTPKTIYEKAVEGTIPCFKIGRVWRFDPSALAWWLRKQHPGLAAAHRDAKRTAPQQ